MKHKVYKNAITFVAICFLGTVFAQKFDKKFTENFKVNKDVEVSINASNTVINVTTWNKNEVQVEAFIEIEGLSKKDAEKYFEDWEFEALGNSKKVKITSKGNFGLHSKNEFIFFNGSDFDFQIPDLDLSNMNGDTEFYLCALTPISNTTSSDNYTLIPDAIFSQNAANILNLIQIVKIFFELFL